MNQCLRAVIVRLVADEAELFLIRMLIDMEIEFQASWDGITLPDPFLDWGCFWIHFAPLQSDPAHGKTCFGYI